MAHDDEHPADPSHDSPDDPARAPELPDDEPERHAVPGRKRRPPAAGSGRAPPPAHVVQVRVATVARALVDGLGRAAVVQAIAREQSKEAAARARARKSGPVDDVELNDLVPYVWGDDPMPERTVDAYIHRAKSLLADEGKRVSRQREYVLAIQLARLNETYRGAYAAGRFHTCLGVIREVNAMFGMYEAIKLLLLNEASAQSDATRSRTGADLSSDAGKAAALSVVIQRATEKDPALGTIFARFARLNTTPASSADTNGSGNGSNGAPKSTRKQNGTNGSGNGKHAG